MVEGRNGIMINEVNVTTKRGGGIICIHFYLYLSFHSLLLLLYICAAMQSVIIVILCSGCVYFLHRMKNNETVKRI